MTASPEPATERVLSTFRPVLTPGLPSVRRHAAPDTARHRAPDTGEIRIVAADDCARRGRHAAGDAPGSPAGEPGEDPLGWLGFRFTSG